MCVIIGIQGKDAIPIRAIPFLTDWTVLAPLELAESLANKGGNGEIRGLTSYRWDGVDVTPIKESWWLDASVAVGSIEVVSRAKNASHREWQIAVIEALPETAFVWLDELEVCFSQTFLDQDSDHASEELENLKPAMLGLNLSPFIERDMLALVMQGFQHLVRPEQTAMPAPVVPAPKQRAQEVRILELLTAQGYDPLKLSQRAQGKPGPKAEVRTLALTERAMFSKSSFDKAWERLRNDGAVAGAE